MIETKLRALEEENQAVADHKMDILAGEEVTALIKKQNHCVSTLLQEYPDLFSPVEHTSNWKECKLLDFRLNGEYKHGRMKIRGYPVDNTAFEAIAEQVDALQ